MRQTQSQSSAQSSAQPQIIAMKIYNVGDYVGTLYLGSPQQAVTVTLDTGSSTLAVDQQYYNPATDTDATQTSLTQNVPYGTGHWSGPVVQTTVTLESPSVNVPLPSGSVSMPSVNVSLSDVYVGVATQQQNMFSSASNGILGLAFQPLNSAVEQSGQTITLEPFFTQLEQAGVTTNVFSFYTLRSMPIMPKNNPQSNPLNWGWLILGGGRERTALYQGTFQEALVVDDCYYNVNLTSIQVGSSPPIPVPPLPPSSGAPSNCVVDSGTNGLMFPTSVVEQVMQQFSSSQRTIIENAMETVDGMVPQRNLDLSQWPPITVTLAGANGDVTLNIQPDTYWQLDAGIDQAGNIQASLRFNGWEEMGILGLPLMNNYFCVFDRSAEDGQGVIAFAPIKRPALA